jgi:hypothetical protein
MEPEQTGDRGLTLNPLKTASTEDLVQELVERHGLGVIVLYGGPGNDCGTSTQWGCAARRVGFISHALTWAREDLGQKMRRVDP